MVAQRLQTLFQRIHASGVVSSGACGADLLAQSAAAGLRRRIVLPFEPATFRGKSVTDRPGDWGPLYDTVVAQLQAAGDLVVMQDQPDTDAAFAAANEKILDEAQALGHATGHEVRALQIWDGRSRGPGDLTESFGVAARNRGMQVLEILTVRTCFVVQGFGEKTDLSTGRVLNLDASYEVIKEAVEQAGLRCIRADEIVHAGAIDKPMYDWIYRADLVIADLSTYNVNAAYELGVRYGVKPRATMIVAENQFKNPFDVGHIVTLPYEHLGKDIGRREARRFTDLLAERIRDLVNQDAVDSPVYTFLALRPPSDSEDTVAAPKTPAAADDLGAVDPNDKSAGELLALARDALAADRFAEARGLLTAIRTMRPRDTFVVQQLALATYKSKLPTVLEALKDAAAILRELAPETTNDPETLGLWGAVHKRFWDLSKDRGDLDVAIAAYERGFYLKQDYYNGINVAFLLNVRAALQQEAGDTPEAIADFVLARRVRRDVMRFGRQALEAGPMTDDARYWILATLWEAAVGLENAVEAESFRAQCGALQVPTWMRESTQTQLEKLVQLLATSPLKP